MRKSYADAWHNGFKAARLWGVFAIPPFWRGKKYRRAWDHGYARARLTGWGA